MRIRLKLLPGKKGTKKLLLKYGKQLVCVRYRYDTERKKRYKTVELIVEEVPWTPATDRIKTNRVYMDKIVAVRVEYGETELRDLVRNAGGKWKNEEKVWELPYRKVRELGLQKRMLT